MKPFYASETLPKCSRFANVIGRLRLTQGDLRTLLGSDGDLDVVLPTAGCDPNRLASLSAALFETLDLVCDDELVGSWLRSPLPRRGGASPLDEAGMVEGDGPIRFVLRPDPSELVRLIADRSFELAQERLCTARTVGVDG